MSEIVILDERLDATLSQVEEWVARFFSHHIVLPYDLDMTWEQDGNKQFWIINPADRSDGKDTPLVNGYIEINPILDRNRPPVSVRIGTFRKELVPLWYDLAQYIKSSILAPTIPPEVLAAPLQKHMILGVEPPEHDIIEPNIGSSTTPSPVESDPCSTIPTKEKNLKKWRRAYAIVIETRQAYREEFLDSFAKKGTGKLADFQDAVANQMGWNVNERTLRKIIKAGDAGCLN